MFSKQRRSAISTANGQSLPVSIGTDVDIKLTQSGSTWTLTDHDDTVETYTQSGGKGTLNSIKLRNGYTQTLTYTSGSLTTVTDNL